MVNYTAVVLMLKHHNPNPCIIVVTKDYKVEMDNDHWNYWSSIHLVYLIIYIFLIWNVILMSWLASLLKTRGSTTWGRYVFIYICWLFSPQTHHSVPDLPLCLGVLKHRASLARGPHLPAKQLFTMDFCLCGSMLQEWVW